jgi:pimeloyl-ACP methyl ester carboxylesterase
MLAATAAVALLPAAATAADRPAPAIPERYLEQEIAWTPCSFSGFLTSRYPDAPATSCASVKVPMDWHAPDAHADIQIAIAYSRATGPSKGLLTSNPGGPGGAGRSLSLALAVDQPKLFREYDLLGFDPRGFGASTPLRCLATAEELAALPTTPDYRERTAQTHAAERAAAQLYAKACSATEFGQFVSSQQTVYDMEFLRALLASEKLSFIGYSYGTWLGSWYADTYPQRVSRFVLDSNMDWTNTHWANMEYDPFSFQRRRDVQLLPWIARQADQIEGLGTTTSQVRARYEGIRALVAAKHKAGGEEPPHNLDFNVAGAIYGNRNLIVAALFILWYEEYATDAAAQSLTEEQLARAYARLDPELQALYPLTFAAAADEAAVPRTPSMAIARARADAAGAPPDELIDIGTDPTTVRCNDSQWRRGAAIYTATADLQTRVFPFLGFVNGVPMCAFWPYPPQSRTVDLAGSPRLLMVSSEFDPATVFEGGVRSHILTSRATRLVAINDEGQHGQYIGSPSPCVDAVGDAFVFDGTMPARDVICTTSPLPAETSVFAVPGPVDVLGALLRGPAPRQSPDQPNPLLQRTRERANQYLVG